MSNDGIKVHELAAILDETPHTVRNWLRDFRSWVPVGKAKNGYNLFGPEAVEQFKLIKHLIRDRGFSTRQVAHYLATGGPIPSAEIAKPEEIAELREMVKQMAAAQEEQIRMQRLILERMEERDKHLTKLLTERAAAARQLPDPAARRRPWWKFWQ